MTCFWLLLAEASALGTIASVVSSLPSLSAFSGILNAPGQEAILNTVNGAGSFTLFAPTNAAFAQAGLQPTDDRSISAILDLHLARGQINYSSMSPLFFVETLLTDSRYVNRGQGLGALLRVSKANEQVIINGMAYILTADIPASNGIIHLIDAVLSPPDTTLTVASKAGFSRWVAAVQSASLTPTVSSTAGITFFVPNNKALSSVDVTSGNSAALRALIQSWAVYGTVTSNSLTDGSSLRAIDGSILTVQVSGKQIKVGGAVLGQKDLLTQNGVIHGAEGAYPVPPQPATVAPHALPAISPQTKTVAVFTPQVSTPVAASTRAVYVPVAANARAAPLASPSAATPVGNKIPTPPPPVPTLATLPSSSGLQLSPELCEQAKVLFPTMFDQVDCSVFAVPSETRQSPVQAQVVAPTLGPRPTTPPPTVPPRPYQPPPPPSPPPTPPPTAPPTAPPTPHQTPMQRSAAPQPMQYQAQAQLPPVQSPAVSPSYLSSFTSPTTSSSSYTYTSPSTSLQFSTSPSFTQSTPAFNSQTLSSFSPLQSQQQTFTPSYGFGASTQPLQQTTTMTGSQWTTTTPQYTFTTQTQTQPQVQSSPFTTTQTQYQTQPSLSQLATFPQSQFINQPQSQFSNQPQFNQLTTTFSSPTNTFPSTQIQFSQLPTMIQAQPSYQFPQTSQFQSSFQQSPQFTQSLSPSFSAFGQAFWP